MSKALDLTNQQFGELLALEGTLYPPNKSGTPQYRGTKYWLCQCSCGNKTYIQGTLLKNGKVSNCGCKNKTREIDLIGQQFGDLIVVAKDSVKMAEHPIHTYWICTCNCGKTTSVRGSDLRTGNTKSCGHRKRGRKSKNRILV